MSTPRDPRDVIDDPVILAALLLHGYTLETAPWVNGDEFDLRVTATAPRMHVNDGRAYLAWPRIVPAPKMQYERDEDGDRRFSVDEMTLPETVITALIGEPLAKLIAIPGDPGFVIDAIYNKTIMNDWKQTVVTLRPLAGESQGDD